MKPVLPSETDNAVTCRLSWTVSGMDCGDCAARIDRAVGRLPGVEQVSTAFGSSRMAAVFDPTAVGEAAIRQEVERLGYAVESGAENPVASARDWWGRALLLAAAACLAAGWLLGRSGWEGASTAAYLTALLLGGWRILPNTLRSLRIGSLDINVLMTAAVLGAVLLGDYAEAATVFLLFSLGEWLEARTSARARGSIRSLLSLAPATARVLREGGETEIALADVEPGAMFRVRPGERIPLDGVVAAGHSTVNQAAVTGESLPVEKSAGDGVYAGTMNGEGVLEARVTKGAGDSVIARIVDLVEESQSRKAPSERLVERFARWYTPAVLALAVCITVIPPLAGWGPWREWFYRALVMLVAACPCALVISTPVAVAAALGAAARRGLLIRGGGPLEALGGVTAVAFDKTGTLTEGLPRVCGVYPAPGVDAEALLSVVAALEAHATHPLADAVRRHAAAAGVEPPAVERFRMVPGLGVRGVVHGVEYWLGSIASVSEAQLGPPELMGEALRLEDEGCTVMALATQDGAMGLVAVMDRPRAEAADTFAALRDVGVRRIIVLSGDSPGTVEAVAGALGADDVRGGLMPEQKRDYIENVRVGQHVAMVGDGINDAPALAAATVGMAMGVAGSDAALDAADVALMGDDLRHVDEAVRLGRRTVAVIRQNIVVAVAAKLLFLAAVMTGHATLWMAVVADMGASLAVTLNAIRLMNGTPAPARRRRGGIA